MNHQSSTHDSRRHKLDGCDVLFLEEPLLSEHPEGIKQLSNLTSSPIALGERLYSRWDFKRYLEGKSQQARHLRGN
jgi:galactonate dehydratase